MGVKVKRGKDHKVGKFRTLEHSREKQEANDWTKTEKTLKFDFYAVIVRTIPPRTVPMMRVDRYSSLQHS